MLKKYSKLLLIVVLIFLASVHIKVGQKIRNLSKSSQKICLDYMSYDAQVSEISQAIYCGNIHSKHESVDFEQLLTHLGLVHILVASGANVHLALTVTSLFPKFLRPFLSFIIIATLLFASGFAAPIVRASMQISLIPLSQKFSLGFSHFRRVSFANIIYVFIFPEDLFSMSFQLSVLASYCIAYVRQQSLWVHICIFAVMSPLLLKLQMQEISFIFNNIFLAPLLSVLMMVVSFVSAILKPVAPHTDFIWIAIHQILTTLNTQDSLPNLNTLMYSMKKWKQLSYVASIVFCFEFCFFLKTSRIQKFLLQKLKS